MHSSYSLLEGALTIAKLAEHAKADRQPALALTDTDNMFGALEFSDKLSSAGIQPIVGCALAVDFGDQEAPRHPGQVARMPRLVLLATHEDGYRNLMRLTSRAFLETPSDQLAHVKLATLEAANGGLIVLTGGPGGPIDLALGAGQAELAAARCERLAAIFGDRLYVELQRHGRPEQKQIEPALLDIAYRQGLAIVATNEPYYAKREDFEAHDALICIAEGRVVAESDRRQLSSEHYFKSRAEMAALFSDLPEALASTVEIAQRCAFRPLTRKPILPRFTAEGGTAVDEAAELRRQAEEGLTLRIKTIGLASGHTIDDYRERLDFELNVIERMKYPGYFLIVADFIQWAKSKGIPVGPGRGSGAGSLVAYSLTITDLDPIRFGLLFERFLNPERVSMPDFDIDFCQERRDEVIRYVQGRYGHDRVAQIITFGTLQARGVLRDVGRVLEMPYGQVDKLCKLVPMNPAAPVTLSRAIAEEPRLQAARDAEPVVRRAFDIAMKLEGLHRHASTHAAGIVIGDRPLAELVPLYRDPKTDMPVTQFNMKWVEPAGLVKFDFLGLKTLSVLDLAEKLVRRRGVDLTLARIPLDDAKSYEMLARGETVGIFQVEGQGMRRALTDMRPDRFEDIIALVALYRPGPMANIPTYCSRKRGHEPIEYTHPKLEPILEATYGIITYQEQVQQIAKDLAGYSLGKADILRRAMGKKDKKEMASQRDDFVTGAVAQGIERGTAEVIFEACAKFAEYGFNKSHSAPYALLTYQTAYMKANYPVEFMAASMTYDMGNTDKLAEFRAEAVRLGVKVESPSINRSGVMFEADGNTIHYALAALKGVGRQAVETIVTARGDKPFRDLADFANRIDPRSLNKRVVESLAAAGAFDALEPSRAAAFTRADAILEVAQNQQQDVATGQGDMFTRTVQKPSSANVEPWLPAERLQREFDAIGFFLSGHPLDDYAGALKRMNVQSWTTFANSVKQGASAGRVAGTVVTRAERRTKTGNKMGILEFSDPSGHYEAIIFQEGLMQYREVLEPGTAVLLMLTAEAQGDDVRARIQSVERLDQAAEKLQKGLRVFVSSNQTIEGVAKRLEPKGDGEVSMILILDAGAAEVEVKLPGRYKVSPQIAGAIKAVPGVIEVQAL